MAREIKKYVFRIGVGGIAVFSGFSCGPSEQQKAATIGPSPAPRPQITETLPTQLPHATVTVKTEGTPPPDPFLQKDAATRAKIEQAKKDELLELENTIIGRVFRFPWERGEAYIATLDTIDKDGKSKTSAVLLSADCIFEALRKENELGSSSIPGAWRPNKRIDHLSVKVSAPSEIGNPITILNAQGLRHKGSLLNCKEETALERLIAAVKRAKWDIPDKTAEFIGWFTREILQGLRSGFRSPTPTPTP